VVVAPAAPAGRVGRRVLVRVKAVPRVTVRRVRVAHRGLAARAGPVAIPEPTAVSSVPIAGPARIAATSPTDPATIAGSGPIVTRGRIVATGPIVPATTAVIVPIVGRVPTVAATVCRRVVSPSR
jgi:hypothetical protein